MKCFIYSIPHNKCGRHLKLSIDWITVNRVKKLNRKIKEFKNEFTEKTEELTEKINQIDNKINIIMNYLGIKKEEYEKKRKRTNNH